MQDFLFPLRSCLPCASEFGLHWRNRIVVVAIDGLPMTMTNYYDPCNPVIVLLKNVLSECSWNFWTDSWLWNMKQSITFLNWSGFWVIFSNGFLTFYRQSATLQSATIMDHFFKFNFWISAELCTLMKFPLETYLSSVKNLSLLLWMIMNSWIKITTMYCRSSGQRTTMIYFILIKLLT